MPWYELWSDLIKKKVCRYLLQRYLGQFLEEKLTLEQLNIDITNGTGTVHNVNLYCQALNDLCEAQEWGIEVRNGRIGSVKVNVPWNALMTEDSFIQVENLYISLRPQIREKEGTSMLESMWSSMSSSMQLAQDCLEKEGGVLPQSAQTNVMEGLERFAQTIDNVLNRVKARLINTEIRLEYLTPDSDHGIALIIKIENLEYQNEAGNDPPDKDNSSESGEQNQRNNKQKSFLLSSYATHHLIMEGITFFTEEFRIVLPEKETPTGDILIASEQFYSTISDLPEHEQFFGGSHQRNNELNKQKDVDCVEEDSDDDDDNDEPEIHRTEHILCGKMSNRLEMRLKMKQADNIPGPKVQLEITLGTFAVFLTPRQLHLLILLSDVLLFDSDNQTTEQKKQHQQMTNKMTEHNQFNQSPMDIDFRKNSMGRYNAMSGGLSLNQGWSSGDNFESLPFLSHNSDVSVLSDSVTSNSSSMTSSMSSSISQSTQRSHRKRHIDLSLNADISNINIRIACFSLVLLHEDILLECSSPLAELSEQSVQKMKLLSDNFFTTIDNKLTVGLGINDMLKAEKLLDDACKCNNLRLLLAPIIIEGEEQRNSNGNQLRLTISIARADFREILKNVSVPILQLSRDKNVGNTSARPEIIINLNQLQRTIRGTSGRKFAPPKTDINVSLTSCQTEFDISIIDRLSGLLNPSPFNTSGSNINQVTKQNINKKIEPKIEINIEFSAVDLKLRFPIADLRPIHDSQRIPWWERNVRSDYLLFNFQQMRLKYLPPNKYDITANEINLFYCENDKTNPIPIGRVKYSETPGTRYNPTLTEYPKITIDIPDDDILEQYKQQMNSDNNKDIGQKNIGDKIGVQNKKTESTPFTSKKHCRESDTPHTKQQQQQQQQTNNNTDDTETLIIPGDRKEMDNFCNLALKTSKIQININLPIVSLQLKSKHLYEVIYNRINTDLLLWQPCAPRCHKQIPTPMISSLLNVGMMDSLYVPFAMCKSGINYESSSSTANSDSESDNDLFYSVSDKKAKRSIVPQQIQKETVNTIAFRLNIGQGMFTMYAPVRDSQNHVIPGQLGEFVMKVRSTYIFSVNGYEGDENLGYFCMQGKSAEMYHCGLVPVPVHDPPLRVIGCILPTHMQSTFYPMSKDLTLNECKGSAEREMISLALQIKSLPEQRRKRIRVAAGIQLITLRHHFALSQHTWLTQLTDMFDVMDYEVQGYTPYGVVTELHLHLWDCAIDYRPLYFGYRAVATIGNFMISSNITTACPGCTLRFIAEDSTLSLAPQTPTNNKSKTNKTEHKITTLPSTDLVCIVDLGLLEISLRLNEKATLTFPKFDLRASINDVHIRTCADSGRALAQFISYLAAEGDFEESDDNESIESDNMSSVHLDSETELLPVKTIAQIPEVTPLQQQRVNSLMADAMEESMRIETTSNDDTPTQDLGVEVFFFPDEKTLTKDHQQHQRMKSESVTSLESLGRKSVITTGSLDNSCSNSPMYDKDDSDSINTEMRDLLDFETSEMGLKSAMETEVLEALPQVTRDLGDINKIRSPQPPPNVRKISSDTDDDFCIIADEERVNYGDKGMQEVPVSEDPIRIVDNHFSIPNGKPDLLQAPQGFPMAVMRYTLCEMSLIWHMYGGHDFLTDDEKQKRKDSKIPYKYTNLPMSEVYKTGVSYSKGSPNSVQMGQASNKMTWKTRGGPERKHSVLMEIQINKVRFSHETYPTYTEQASRQVLLITELEVRDRLEVSNINKFLYHPSKSKHGTQHMVALKALHLRPDASLPAQECCLRISLLPLRLNIDQDSLEFLVSFFLELGGSSDEKPDITKQQQSTPSHQPPVMMVEAAQELHARKMVSENLLLLMEDDEEKDKETTESVSDISENTPIYFRNIVFSPAVPIRLDYQGKRIEFNHGPLAGLIMGLGQLQCSQIKLKSISHRHGILGVDRLLYFLLQEWLQDIKRNQLQSILVGVGPMHSFVQLFQGIKDLFWLPIEQYQKDGRIVRGLQLGAQSFTARTALAALEITTRIIHLLQITAETAYDMVSPGPSVRRGRGNRKGKKKRSHPPQDIREGVASAYQIMKDGFGETAHQIVEVAVLEHDQKGYTGAVGAVVRQIPPTVVRPLVLATQATSKVLGGVRNQLVPDARVEARQKWKEDEEN